MASRRALAAARALVECCSSRETGLGPLPVAGPVGCIGGARFDTAAPVPTPFGTEELVAGAGGGGIDAALEDNDAIDDIDDIDDIDAIVEAVIVDDEDEDEDTVEEEG